MSDESKTDKKTVNKLDRAQTYKLARWLDHNWTKRVVANKWSSSKTAEEATTELGILVTSKNVANLAAKVLGKDFSHAAPPVPIQAAVKGQTAATLDGGKVLVLEGKVASLEKQLQSVRMHLARLEGTLKAMRAAATLANPAGTSESKTPIDKLLEEFEKDTDSEIETE